MRKFVLLLLAVLLMLPGMSLIAQTEVDPIVVEAIEAYATNLPQGYGLIRVDDFAAVLIERTPVLLDVREVDEYEAGHLFDSFNVPIRTLAQNLDLLPDQSAEIVVICKGGARAMLAAASLGVLGYDNVKVLVGGYDAWVGADMPTTTEGFVVEPSTAPDIDPVLVAAVDNYLSNLPAGFGLVNVQNLSVEMIEEPPLLIDVRSDAEWENGYIEGAEHIWINEFWARQAEWPGDKDAKIVIYCAGGWRGGIATVIMNLMGYTNVRNLMGGSNAWVAAGLPLEGVPKAEPEPATEFVLEDVLAAYLASLPATFNALRPADLLAELEAGSDALLVDVRTADEYVEGFIEGAINIPINEIMANLDLLPDLDQELIIYCGSGHRSAVVMTALNLLGYTNVRSMLSGTNVWAAANYPLVTEPPEVVRGTAPEFNPVMFELLDEFLTNIPRGYYTVRPTDLSAELIENPPVLIDVRNDNEWAAGHIEGAIHIPLRDLFAQRDAWPAPDEAIVFYDNPTHRSSIAMTFLRLLGYENVRALGGGVGGWTNAGFELVTD
ncbi:MAG: rhodanese-like domain-containing protein [Aggregatilineales bacterium]